MHLLAGKQVTADKIDNFSAKKGRQWQEKEDPDSGT